MKKIITILLLAMLVVVPQAFAWKIFGFEFGGDDNGLQERQEEKEPVLKKYQIREQLSIENQNEGLVNIDEAVELVNKDPYAEKFMQKFEDDNFCLISDHREEYITIDQGEVQLLDEKPERCYEIKGTEEFGLKMMQKYKAQEYVHYSEVMGEIKTPLRLKLKIMGIFAKEVIS